MIYSLLLTSLFISANTTEFKGRKGCANITFINEVDDSSPTSEDKRVVARAKRQCSRYYKRSPCVHIVDKVAIGDYLVTCTQKGRK